MDLEDRRKLKAASNAPANRSRSRGDGVDNRPKSSKNLSLRPVGSDHSRDKVAGSRIDKSRSPGPGRRAPSSSNHPTQGPVDTSTKGAGSAPEQQSTTRKDPGPRIVVPRGAYRKADGGTLPSDQEGPNSRKSGLATIVSTTSRPSDSSQQAEARNPEATHRSPSVARTSAIGDRKGVHRSSGSNTSKDRSIDLMSGGDPGESVSGAPGRRSGDVSGSRIDSRGKAAERRHDLVKEARDILKNSSSTRNLPPRFVEPPEEAIQNNDSVQPSDPERGRRNSRTRNISPHMRGHISSALLEPVAGGISGPQTTSAEAHVAVPSRSPRDISEGQSSGPTGAKGKAKIHLRVHDPNNALSRHQSSSRRKGGTPCPGCVNETGFNTTSLAIHIDTYHVKHRMLPVCKLCSDDPYRYSASNIRRTLMGHYQSTHWQNDTEEDFKRKWAALQDRLNSENDALIKEARWAAYYFKKDLGMESSRKPGNEAEDKKYPNTKQYSVAPIKGRRDRPTRSPSPGN